MTSEVAASEDARPASIVDAIVPLVVLAVLIGGSLIVFGLDALDGPVQVALILCSMVAMLIAVKNGHPWSAVEHSGERALSSVSGAIFILLSVGALIGTWNLSGTIPTLVYYGLKILSPGWYYLAAALLCAVVSTSIGSSWTTAGTVGVGLIGIAAALGVSLPITAGAVISGAYFGDKTSPLSETTILSAQMVGVEVRTHIRNQLWTSVPAFGLACLAFLGFGLFGPSVHNFVPTTIELAKLDQIYWISPLNLLPIVLLVILSVRKLPPAIALMGAALFAGVMGAIFQPDVVTQFLHSVGSTHTGFAGSIDAVWRAMANGFSINSGIPEIDRLLSRGGMDSMLPTVWLIIGAVTFGTLLDDFGLLNPLLDPLKRAAHRTSTLFLSVFACAFGLNVVAGDQYIALVLPTRLFRDEFTQRKLAATNLSRLAADSGTVTSPLVPWNSCGAFMGAVLGVKTMSYLPFAVFCIASPVLSVLYGFTGFRVTPLDNVALARAGEGG